MNIRPLDIALTLAVAAGIAKIGPIVPPDHPPVAGAISQSPVRPDCETPPTPTPPSPPGNAAVPADALPPLPAAITPPTPSATPPQSPSEADDAAPSKTTPQTSPGDDTLLAESTADAATPAPADPGAPGEIPPTGPDTAGATGEAKIDFLQRSNLIHAKLLDNERAVDPFGMIMDPANAKATPVLADQYAEVEETPVLNQSSLKSALATLPITGVYPSRELIVIGARSFAVGGQFGMRLQELTIRLRFEGIRNGEIFFKDMETREVTSIPFNPRPAEFEPLRKGEKRQTGNGIQAMNDLYIAN